MEKKKDEKLCQKNQDTESHEYLSNEDHKQTRVDCARKNPKTGSPPQEIISAVTQQYIPTVQWPYTSQPTLEHSTSRYAFNTQQISPTNATQTQTPFMNQPQQQQNPLNHQPQIGQSQVIPAAGAFCPPQRPGFHAVGTGSQPFVPMVTSDSNWQIPIPVVVGGASSGAEHISAYMYQGGFSYPTGFPGPFYHPSSLWWQPQQSHPPNSLQYPACAGGYGYFGAPPPISDSSLSGQPHQSGIIPLASRLPHKHQQMWEAQSAENVHLRTALCRLEAEMAAYRGRLMRLEAEVSSLKAQRDSVVERSVGAGAVLSVQNSKRGRLKRPIASTTVLPFSEDLQPKSRGRKPMSSYKVESEAKGLSSNKESLNKEEEDGAKASHPMLGIGKTSIHVEDDVKISNNSTNFCVSKINESKLKLSTDIPTPSTFQNRTHPNNPGIQISGVGHYPSLDLKRNSKEENRKTAFSIPPQPTNVTNAKGASALHTQMWHSNIISEDCRRNMLDIRSHAFYDDTNIVRHGGKIFSGWSFVNEDASEEHEDMVGSGKDEREMEEDACSAADEMRQPKDEDTFGNDPSAAISKGSSQLNRW